MTSAAMAMVGVFMRQSCPTRSLLKQRQRTKHPVRAAGFAAGFAAVFGQGSAVVHLLAARTTPPLPSVPRMILRATATTLAGATALYLLAWRIAVSIDQTLETDQGVVVVRSR
jgi:hypothetical protein